MTEPRFTKDQLIDRLSPLSSKLGIRCTSVEDDCAIYEMPFRQDNTTIGDIVHGGAILTLADCAATGAAWSTVDDPARHRGLTVDLSLSFLSAARGTDLTATARIVRRGGTICFCEVDIHAGDEHVARASVTYKLTREPTPAEAMGKVFAGKDVSEQATILAELERTGAALYRAFAEQTQDSAARQQLEDSAVREEENAETLDTLSWPASKGDRS